MQATSRSSLLSTQITVESCKDGANKETVALRGCSSTVLYVLTSSFPVEWDNAEVKRPLAAGSFPIWKISHDVALSTRSTLKTSGRCESTFPASVAYSVQVSNSTTSLGSDRVVRSERQYGKSPPTAMLSWKFASPTSRSSCCSSTGQWAPANPSPA